VRAGYETLRRFRREARAFIFCSAARMALCEIGRFM
jgi:hypothetical protein